MPAAPCGRRRRPDSFARQGAQGLRNPSKILLVGCGHMAHSYAAAISLHPGMQLLAVVDENPAAARAFGAVFDCPHYASLGDCLRWGGPDISVVCAPPARHPEILQKLARPGTGILFESPLAPDPDGARNMAGIAGALGVRLMAGSRFRYAADVAGAREWIRSGNLGRVLVFEIDFREPPVSEGHEGFRGGGALPGGAHALDIARYLFGPLLRIRAEESAGCHLHGGDAVQLDLHTRSGLIGTARLCRTAKSARHDYVRIYGSRGTLSIGWRRSACRLMGEDGWARFGEGTSTLDAIARQLEDLSAAVESRPHPALRSGRPRPDFSLKTKTLASILNTPKTSVNEKPPPFG